MYTNVRPTPFIAPVLIGGVPFPGFASYAFRYELLTSNPKESKAKQLLLSPDRMREPLQITFNAYSVGGAPEDAGQAQWGAVLAAGASPLIDVMPSVPTAEYYSEAGAYDLAPRRRAWIHVPHVGLVQADYEQVLTGAATFHATQDQVTVTTAPCVVAYLGLLRGRISVDYQMAPKEGLKFTASFIELTDTEAS